MLLHRTTSHPLPTPLSILFQDGDVIIVDKPPGLAVVPEQTPGETVINRLAAHVTGKIYIVHRLDKDTSGVLLLAKNARSHQFLNDQFSHRLVRKVYYALVHGNIAAEKGIIRAPLRQFGSGRMGVDPRRGKPSQTVFRVLRRFGEFTLLEAQPFTGRRHQLRVHMYYLHHPIVGDRSYGDRMRQTQFPRLMLHAALLTFQLPSGQECRVRAPLPDSFNQTLTRVTRSSPPPRR